MNILVIIELNNLDNKLINYLKKNKNANYIFFLLDSDKTLISKKINSIFSNLNYQFIDFSNKPNNYFENYISKYYKFVNLEQIKKILSKSHIKNNYDYSIILSDFYEKNHLKSDINANYIKFIKLYESLNKKKFDKIYTFNINNFIKSYLETYYLRKQKTFLFNYNFISLFTKSIIFLIYYFLRSIVFKLIFLFRIIKYDKSTIFQTYFPFINKDNYTYLLEDQCLYFNKISSMYKNNNLWILHSIKSIKVSLLEYFNFIIFSKSNITLIENEIFFLDYFKILTQYLNLNFKTFKFLNQKINIENDHYNYFIRYNLSTSLIRKNFIYNLICSYSYKNLFSKIHNNAKFIYLFENQSWEKAANFNKPDNVKSIAYNHTSVSKTYLFFYSNEGDKLNKTYKRTLPDVVAANSDYSFDLLKTQFDNIYKVESLRHNHLKNTIFENKSSKNLLFLFSVNQFENNYLLNLVYQFALDKRLLNYKIKVRFHPSQNVSIKESFKNKIDVVQDVDYNKTISKTKYIICGTTSSCIEAIYSGSLIFIPKITSTLFKPPIYDFKNMFYEFNNISDFLEIIVKDTSDIENRFNYFKKQYWNINYEIPYLLKEIIDE